MVLYTQRGFKMKLFKSFLVTLGTLVLLILGLVLLIAALVCTFIWIEYIVITAMIILFLTVFGVVWAENYDKITTKQGVYK